MQQDPEIKYYFFLIRKRTKNVFAFEPTYVTDKLTFSVISLQDKYLLGLHFSETKRHIFIPGTRVLVYSDGLTWSSGWESIRRVG
jgi:hypothetical protein